MTPSTPVAWLATVLADASDQLAVPPAHAHVLRDAAVAHGVDALVWQRVDGMTAPPRLQEVRAALHAGVRTAVAREIFIQRELRAVFASLARAGIPVLVTKGTALAYTVYAEPWLRPRLDTDLFLRRADLDAAATALQALGYARSAAVSTGEHVSHQAAFERVDAQGVHHILDVHWKLANPQLFADVLDFETLWPASRTVPALGARAPSTAASLALACVHRLAHHQGHERLVWLYDMVLLGRELDPAGWATLAELAERAGIASVCLDGLLAARAVGLAVPPDVEERLGAAAPREPSRVYVERRVTRRDVLISDLARLGTWQARVRLLREHVFPSSTFMRQRYGSGTRWPLPALYLHRFLTGAVKWNRS